MRYLFAGGGTGGHIYPALSLAQALTELDPDAEFLFVGSQRGLEKTIIPKYGYALRYLDIQALQRRLSWDTLVTLWKAIGALRTSRRLITDFQPDVVIGTGGYVSGPPVLVASWMRVPIVLQEQNALPGVTTKLLFPKADAVLLGYGVAQNRLSSKKGAHRVSVYVTGNPIRADIGRVTREEGCRQLGLDPQKLTLLVFGASQGSRAINNTFFTVWQKLALRSDLQVLWQTGESQFATIKERLPQVEATEPGLIRYGNLQLRAYIHEMPAALACADVVVSRAGAISLAEITAKGLPSVLIPLPTAAENHQEHNARALETAGAALVLLEKDLAPDVLFEKILLMVENTSLRQQMAEASKKLGKPEAAQNGAQIILNLATRR